MGWVNSHGSWFVNNNNNYNNKIKHICNLCKSLEPLQSHNACYKGGTNEERQIWKTLFIARILSKIMNGTMSSALKCKHLVFIQLKIFAQTNEWLRIKAAIQHQICNKRDFDIVAVLLWNYLSNYTVCMKWPVIPCGTFACIKIEFRLFRRDTIFFFCYNALLVVQFCVLTFILSHSNNCFAIISVAITTYSISIFRSFFLYFAHSAGFFFFLALCHSVCSSHHLLRTQLFHFSS